MWPGLDPSWTFPAARSKVCLYRHTPAWQDYRTSLLVFIPLRQLCRSRLEPVIATNSYENKNSYTMSVNNNPVMFISTIARIRLIIR